MNTPRLVRISALTLSLGLTTALPCCSPALAVPPTPATLPLKQVETLLPSVHGATLRVAAGGNFQAALAKAAPGDVIELEAGADFRGPFVLPRKTGDDWIVVRSSALYALPPADSRISPADAPFMPKLIASSGSVLTAAAGAHNYRFIGIEFKPAPRSFLHNLVELGAGNELLPELPNHLVFDRCYLHGDPLRGTRRGIALNGAHTAVINSWLADFKETGADSQALAGWNGTGPFLIANNHLEGAGENVMFGGATPAIKGLVPADIEIRGNHFFKPLSWKADDTSYEKSPWTVKNLLELKNARRVLIEGNVFEHNWAAAQNGFSILFTVRNEDGAVPWASVEDVSFRNNILTGIASGINVLGHDDNRHPSGQTSRLMINNNLFAGMGGSWGGGTFLQLLDGVGDLAIEHNTVLNSASILVSEGRPHTHVSFNGNIVMHNEYGIIGTGTGTGLPTLQRYFPAITLDHNMIVGGQAQHYPGSNLFPASQSEVGFVDTATGDFRLAHPGSGAQTTTRECGVDFITLCAALSSYERNAYCRFAAASH